jgi:hypothetical protein
MSPPASTMPAIWLGLKRRRHESQRRAKRQLSGKELSALAQRIVDSNDPAEVERLTSEITRGFYGD